MTGQRLAVEFEIPWFRAEGTARYYLYNGFLMYGSKVSETADLEHDQPFISLNNKEIRIDSIFMGGSTGFPLKKLQSYCWKNGKENPFPLGVLPAASLNIFGSKTLVSHTKHRG